MFKLVIIFIFELFIISISQCQTYLECKFDDHISPCRLIPDGTAPELKVENFVYLSDRLVDPLLPLSDVTSIITPTLGNNLYCKLPYKLDGNSTDLYFCSKFVNSPGLSSCITTEDTMQECMLGNYVELQLQSTEKYTYYIEVTGTTSSSCLSLYYYITRPNAAEIVIWSTDLIRNTVQQIGKASDVPYNGWHRVEFNFSPYIDNYRVHFDLQRLDYSNDVLFVALDEILIIDGPCSIKDENNSMSFTTQESASAEFSSTTILSTLFSSTESDLITSIEQFSSETNNRRNTISISTDWITSDLENSTTISISLSTAITSLQSTTTTGNIATTTTPESNLGLILTLSVSPAIALVIIFIVFIIYRVRVKRRLHRISGYNYEKYFPMQSPSNQSNENEGFDGD